ncbi:tetraspanin family protein [Pseudobutyrivibrio sp.]|jgi:prefoldin subunit 5|uniref:hypothetical protein n=1 Tax=Pseudobutyrivibrio sp. TaxID=2014367 RepID=UPI0025E30E16|nr:hypothetical protein [Pseudobutyrivibrio sp.]MBQ6461787.1 hypothetical protein [Pseudobutyrivibrio sp.]
MAEKIKVNHTAVETAVSNMNKAIKNYNELTANGFDGAIEELDGMNSDYVDKLQRTLECLNPKVKEKISKSITKYTNRVEKASNTLKSVDQQVGEKIEGE